MKAGAARIRTPSWSALVVVCRVCQKRSSGPKHLKTKDVVGEARSVLKRERPRPRVIASGCLGLCPKRAIAIARVGAGEVARIGEAAAVEDVAVLVSRPAAALTAT